MTGPIDATLSVVVPGSPRFAAWYTGAGDGRTLRAKGRPPIVTDTSAQPTAGVVPQLFTARSQVISPPIAGPEPFVYEVTRPTRLNTGLTDRSLVINATTTTATTHNFPSAAYPSGTASNPTVIENLWFTKKLNISGQYFTFLNCWISGGWELNETPIQATNIAVLGIVFERCVIIPQNPQSDSPFAKGHHMTFDRCYIRGCTDGVAHIGVGGASYAGIDQSISARGCLIERGIYRSPDYGASGKLPDNASHLDLGMQTRGGDNFLFSGCAIYGFIDPAYPGEGGKASVDMPLSGTHVSGQRVSHNGPYTLSLFMFSPFLGALRNWVCRGCWLDGATVMFVLAEHVTGISVLSNRMGRLHRGSPGILSVKSTATGIALSGNHYWYELGPNGEKWPYSQQPLAEQGETAPPAGVIAAWAAAGITTDENTWPAANLRTNG